MKAIAAMSLNRVIGKDGQLPWHLPEDLRWFKAQTAGGVVVMGRHTWAAMGQPLPGRRNVVISRTAELPQVEVVRRIEDFDEAAYAPQPVWLIGGGELYRALLPQCAELLLTVVQREVAGDVFFPPFEHNFTLVETLRSTPELEIRRYLRTL